MPKKTTVEIVTGGRLDCLIEAFRLIDKYDIEVHVDFTWLITFLELLWANEDGTIFTGREGIDEYYIKKLAIPVPNDDLNDFLKELVEKLFEFEVLK